MAIVNEEFVKFMTNYVDVLNALRLSIIGHLDKVGASADGGVTIPQRIDAFMTLAEAEAVIKTVAAGVGVGIARMSETSTEGLTPGLLAPSGGVVGTRKLNISELAYSNSGANIFKVTALNGAFSMSTGMPRDVLGWFEPGVTDSLIAYEGGKYHKYPNDGETPLTDKKVASITTIPIGVSIYYPSTDVPVGFVIEDGRALLKTDYPDLYAIIGDAFGSTTAAFNVANKSGLFCIGGASPGIRHAISEDHAHSHIPSTTQTRVQADDSTHIASVSAVTGAAFIGYDRTWSLPSDTVRAFTVTGPSATSGNPNVSVSPTENRPKNIALVSCIRAK